MTTNYYQNLLLDLNHEEHPFEENNLSLKLSHASTTSSSSLAPTLFNISDQDQGVVTCSSVQSKPLLKHQEFVHDLIPSGASWKSKQEMNGLKLSVSKRESNLGDNHDHDHDHKDHHWEHQSDSSSSIKWMSSKMRMLKKVIKSEDQTFVREASNNSHPPMNFAHHNIKHNVNSSTEITEEKSTNNMNSHTLRSCVDCNTTRTPLWRSGPQGPKSLCNACGIRQRKARRAAMAAIVNEAPTNNNTSKLMMNAHKETGAQQMKKRSKTSNCKKAMTQNNHNNRKLCFEEFALSLSKKLSLRQVFFPDEKEKEAAILLMAMSCGLVEAL